MEGETHKVFGKSGAVKRGVLQRRQKAKECEEEQKRKEKARGSQQERAVMAKSPPIRCRRGRGAFEAIMTYFQPPSSFVR